MKYAIIALAVVVIIVVVNRLRDRKTEETGRSLPDSPRPLLRQFNDLRPQDFEEHSVWVNCHVIDYDEPWYDDTDAETFRTASRSGSGSES